jgi:DNA segregation ATPase FtsK/SpoIIIE, S-DNA-T family
MATPRKSRKSGPKRAAKAPAKKAARDEGAQPTLPGVGGNDRRNELIGVIAVGVGVLVFLGVVLDIAGPLGRLIDAILGWVFGLGRYLVPIPLIAAGVAFIRKTRSSSPTRLILGWSMMAAALLGILQLIRGPESWWASRADFSRAGGFVGSILAQPVRALIATPGAAVLFIAILLGGALLVTQTSLRTMAERTGRSVISVARPIGRVTRRAIEDLSSLSSDRQGSGDAAAAGERPRVAGEASDLAAPRIYDFTEEDPGAVDRAASPAKKTAKKKNPATGGAAPPEGPGARIGDWELPPLGLLKLAGTQVIDRKQVEARGLTLQESLASHGVDTTLVGMTVGPTVTRYELELAAGVKVARVTSLQRDIAYAMAATDVRILAPIPGRSAIGVEVPNHERQLVALGDLMVSPEATAATHPLEVAIGKDIAGRSVFLNLATTPHMLIAGATGAGKSSGINCIITSLLMRTTPDQVRLILIDPKQVEMGQYQHLPHLLTQPVTNPKKAANALGWAVKEMERRYDVLSRVGFRDISGYNSAVDAGTFATPEYAESPLERMPYIVVVVDELNDLMMVAARDVEESITRIAQKARAVGIHLIVATQRPSVNVITGVIKANVPARMAFAVSSLTDSRVILDQPGAEKLVGKGDMLLLPGNSSVAQRIQGSFVSEEEVREVVAHWRTQAPTVTNTDVEADSSSTDPDSVTSSANAFSAGSDEDEDTAMMRQAMELVVRSQLGSTSMLQRKLKVGFARAGRIMDLLEQRGVVGPSEGSKAREVLMTVEEFELLSEAGEL